MKRSIGLELAVILSLVCLFAAKLFGGDFDPAGANLLRNADLGDDWITLLPETKNHHWCYPSEFFHRRDYNPDTWDCQGSWQWQNADGPRAGRRLVLSGPQASVVAGASIGWPFTMIAAAAAFPMPAAFPI